MEVVIDTCVIFSGLYSDRGASWQILQYVSQRKLIPVLSNSLIYEYEDVLKRNFHELGLSLEDIDRYIDGLCVSGKQVEVSYIWRPQLKDADDEHVLELSVASESKILITHNLDDFKTASRFGVKVLPPSEFLKRRRKL